MSKGNGHNKRGTAPETFNAHGNQVTVSPDGSAHVVSKAGVVLDISADGTPTVSGLTGFGIQDLAEVKQIQTRSDGDGTVFLIEFRNGATATVGYVGGRLGALSAKAVTLSLAAGETHAMLSTKE